MTPHSSATIFQVSNLDAALEFYVGGLGFTEEFRFGQHAGVCHGPVHLHLNGNETHLQPVGQSSLYVFCDEVDRYFTDIQAKGVNVKYAPMDEPYGMRDFMIADPDGNLINFGCEVRKA